MHTCTYQQTVLFILLLLPPPPVFGYHKAKSTSLAPLAGEAPGDTIPHNTAALLKEMFETCNFGALTLIKRWLFFFFLLPGMFRLILHNITNLNKTHSKSGTSSILALTKNCPSSFLDSSTGDTFGVHFPITTHFFTML